LANIDDNDIIKQKLYLFAAVFLFEFIFTILINIYRKCPIQIGKTTRHSIQTALVAIVGQSLYYELLLTNSPLLPQYDDARSKYLIMSIVIICLISLSYLIELGLTNYSSDGGSCANRHIADEIN
jgi:tellurite resistance protein TehA-like permease